MINETNLLYFQRMCTVYATLRSSGGRSIRWFCINQTISSIPNYSEPKRSFSSSDMQCKRRGREGGIPQSLIQLLIFLRFISQVNKNAVCPKNTDSLDTLPRYMHNHNKNWGIFGSDWIDVLALFFSHSHTTSTIGWDIHAYRVDGLMCKWGIVSK